jgi:hypothetical protein
VMLMLIVVSLVIKLVQLCFINMALTMREVCERLFFVTLVLCLGV